MFSHEAGRRFLLNFRIYCSFHHDEAGIFQMFLFCSEIVNKMRQVSIAISEFTHSIKQTCGRCDVKFILTVSSPQFSIFVKYSLKNVKSVVQACKLLKLLSKKA